VTGRLHANSRSVAHRFVVYWPGGASKGHAVYLEMVGESAEKQASDAFFVLNRA